MGRFFTVRTDHRNLLYLSNSTVPKLVRWRVILSEFNFVPEHIAGRDNVVVDGITRVNTFRYNAFQYNKRSIHRDDFLTRIFRLVGEDDLPEKFEDKDEGELEDSASEGGTFHVDGSLPIKGPSERYGIFSKFHNSSVGHFGITRSLEAMTKGWTWPLL
jgi:hypothetical protein